MRREAAGRVATTAMTGAHGLGLSTPAKVLKGRMTTMTPT
jgi:hypothetical protein